MLCKINITTTHLCTNKTTLCATLCFSTKLYVKSNYYINIELTFNDLLRDLSKKSHDLFQNMMHDGIH